MIRLVQKGQYKLIETKGQTKILFLWKKAYAWTYAADTGEILVISHTPHVTDHLLAEGGYRVYEVKGERQFHDMVHLELFVGEGVWQGYLLPTGLPTDNAKRKRIIPTKEIITKSVGQ